MKVKERIEKRVVQISELSALTGVSARSLRHYEDRGILIPNRTENGYRDYAQSDVIRVAKIRAMVSAGIPTSTIQRYFDCARSGQHGLLLQMCPALRAELEALEEHLVAQQNQLGEKARRLRELAEESTER